LLVAAQGCAGRSGNVRSDEDVAVVHQAAAPAPAPTPPASRRPRLPVKKVKPARSHAVETPALDLALKRFNAVRSTASKKKLPEMPPEVEQRWHAFLDEVENAAADDADGNEQEMLSVFIRTRVTLDAEFEQDARRYKVVPPELKERHRQAITLVKERVNMLKAVSGSTSFALHERLPQTERLLLRYPVHVVNVTSYFGQRRDPIKRAKTRFHSGVDLGGAAGTLIACAGPGIVAYADWQGGNGNHVIVVHPNGYRTHYSHLSKILVQQGDTIEEGAPLGLMGNTGRSTGPHLHFSVSRNGSFLDPLDVLEVPLGPDGAQVPQS